MTIFWDISKWNRGQTKWYGGSTEFISSFAKKEGKIQNLLVRFASSKKKKKKKKKLVRFELMSSAMKTFQKYSIYSLSINVTQNCVKISLLLLQSPSLTIIYLSLIIQTLCCTYNYQ